MDIHNDVVVKLSELLRGGIDVHRCAAAAALGRIGDPRSVDVLIEALLDEDPDVRTDAASALANNPDPRATDQLMQNLLGDPCAEVKDAAIRALTALRHQPLVPWLRRLAVRRDPEIVWDDGKFYDDGWDDWVDIQVQAIKSLGDFAVEDAVGDIVVAVDDEMGQDLTEVGLGALACLGEPGVAVLVRFLDSKDHRQRRLAVKYLVEADAMSARKALAAALADSSAEVRLAAARGLAVHDAKDPRLAALFDDRDPVVRAGAVALCGRDHPDHLEAMLSDPSEKVRRAVLAIVSDNPQCLDAERITAQLTDALSANDPETAAVAADALASVAPATAFDVLARVATDDRNITEARVGALKALARLDDSRRIQTATALAADDERQIRYQALVALARMAGAEGEEAALASLMAALRGESAPQPEDADETEITAGEGTDDGEIQILTDDDSNAGPEVERSEEPVPTSTLESILGGDSPHLQAVQRTSSKVELSDRDLEFLGLARSKVRKKRVDPAPKIAPHLDVPRFAARVAGDVHRHEMATALSAQLTAKDPELVLAALESLTRIAAQLRTLPQPIIDTLADMVGGKESQRRLLALRALGVTDTPRAMRVLRACLHDSDSFLRTESLRALSAQGALEPVQAESLLNDPDPGVRLAAAEALSRIGDDENCETLADFAFAFEGYHHREVAKILRELAPQDASRRMLDVLEQPDRRREWQAAIEVLAELNELRLSPSRSDGGTHERVGNSPVS